MNDILRVISEVRPGIFRIPVDLPGSPLKKVNAYLIRVPGERNLLIDNGFNASESKVCLHAALSALGVWLAETDLCLTHSHVDHCGMTKSLITSPDQKVYISDSEYQWQSRFDDPFSAWERIFMRYRRNGMDESIIESVARNHPAKIYSMTRPVDFTLLREGDCLRYGGYDLQVSVASGHSPGHICLIDAQKAFAFVGDHVLGSITPLIAGNEERDMLGEYLASLDALLGHATGVAYAGHGEVIQSLDTRIGELKRHHQIRLQELRGLLAEKPPMTAYALSAHISWSGGKKAWQKYPPLLRCFAVSETLAHLVYLEKRGMAAPEDGKDYRLWRVA